MLQPVLGRCTPNQKEIHSKVKRENHRQGSRLTTSLGKFFKQLVSVAVSLHVAVLATQLMPQLTHQVSKKQAACLPNGPCHSHTARTAASKLPATEEVAIGK